MNLSRLSEKDACLTARLWFEEKFGQSAHTQKVLLAAIKDDHEDWVKWTMERYGDTFSKKQLAAFFLPLVKRYLKVLDKDLRIELQKALVLPVQKLKVFRPEGDTECLGGRQFYAYKLFDVYVDLLCGTAAQAGAHAADLLYWIEDLLDTNKKYIQTLTKFVKAAYPLPVAKTVVVKQQLAPSVTQSRSRARNVAA